MNRLRSVAARGAELVLETVFPPRCAGCERRGVWVCADCLAPSARPDAGCDRCGQPDCRCDQVPDSLDAVRSVGPYEGWLRAAIIALKYEGETSRARHLGDLLSGTVALHDAPFCLVPVPLHPRRLRERGYNQSALLARRAAERTGVPVVEALIRTRATAHQVGLDATSRATNVAGAFALAKGYPHLQGRRVLLIDDVRTSGATLGACAEAARGAGAVWVGAATLAHG